MIRTLKSGFFFLLATVSVTLFFACASVDETDVANDESVGRAQQSLTIAEKYARVMNECSQAMTGSWWTYNSSNWPTSETYGTYAYVSSDSGAWSKLLDATYGCTISTITKKCITPWTRGWWTSCRSTTSVRNYIPCSNSITYYGNLDVLSLYDCQGTCTNGIHHHGGQCKPFMNLIAYRSGTYQNLGYDWKVFPSDTAISSWSTAADQMPYATYENIVAGDYLRRPSGHAVIVVRKISSTNVIVLDSNWSGGDGAEQISSHAMIFDANLGNSNSNLGAYRVLKCVYTGAC